MRAGQGDAPSATLCPGAVQCLGGSAGRIVARCRAAIFAGSAITLAAVRPFERLLVLAPVALSASALTGVDCTFVALALGHALPPFHAQLTIIC